ncbi:Nnf1-domain-containing protein [Xylariaceae sp. FL1272]|nr:Nnf1-domain-containing protein [Xylariaceae sp. FL1272]
MASEPTSNPEPSQAQNDAQQPSSEQTPASPPLPQRHTVITPGTRATQLQKIYEKVLSGTLNKISWDNFAACYPTIAAQAPATLRLVQGQMVDRLRSLCKKEFDSIQQARNVITKLNELDSLVSVAEQKRDASGSGEPPVPPHVLPAEDILAAHLAPHLAQQQSQLNARLQTTQAHNAKLYEDIQRQRAEIESLTTLLEKVLEDVDSTNELYHGVVGDVAREARAVEIEMADA